MVVKGLTLPILHLCTLFSSVLDFTIPRIRNYIKCGFVTDVWQVSFPDNEFTMGYCKRGGIKSTSFERWNYNRHFVFMVLGFWWHFKISAHESWNKFDCSRNALDLIIDKPNRVLTKTLRTLEILFYKIIIKDNSIYYKLTELLYISDDFSNIFNMSNFYLQILYIFFNWQIFLTELLMWPRADIQCSLSVIDFRCSNRI